MPNTYPKTSTATNLSSLNGTLRDHTTASRYRHKHDPARDLCSWLSTNKVFASLADERTSYPQFEFRRVGTKEILFYKGDPAIQLYVLLSGKVKVSAPSEDGKEIIFGIFGPGELVGEMGVLEGADHTATVTALEPTELAVMDRREFFKLLEQCPKVAIRLLTVLCERLRRTSEIAEDISFLPLPVRLAKKLYTLAKTYGKETGEGMRIELHLYQQELANLVGTSRESINKQLATWQAEGLLSMVHGILVIHDYSKLISLAKQDVEEN